MVTVIPDHFYATAWQISEGVEALDDNNQSGAIANLSTLQNMFDQLFFDWCEISDHINNALLCREIEFYLIASQVTTLQMHLLLFSLRPDLQEKGAELLQKLNLFSTHIQTGLISDLFVIEGMVDKLTAEFCDLQNQSRQ